jgi:hypothetical protein
MIGNTRQHIGKPGTRVDIVEARRGNQRIHRRRSFAAAITAGEQPALPAESHPTQSALGRIVRQANAPVIEEACERIPSLERLSM